MLRRKDNEVPAQEQPAALRENSEVNAKIDNYIRDNPTHWEYIKALPLERLARTVVLSAVKQQEQQTRMRNAIVDKVNQDPELSATVNQAVAKLPESVREAAKVRIGGAILREMRQPRNRAQGARV